MIIQITAARGPIECELAAGLYLNWLRCRNPSIVVKQENKGKEVVIGGKTLVSYKSVLVDAPDDIPCTLGTVQWICPSPVRQGHKRKNWFVKVIAVQDDSSYGSLSGDGLGRVFTHV